MNKTDFQKSCCLLTVVLGVVGISLVGLLAIFAARIMPIVVPKMMARMMPKMMEYMEEAQVEPPCAKIMKEYFEKHQIQATST